METSKKKIYMKCPQGISDIGKDNCIILNKYIYCLVQAARQYCKRPSKEFKFVGDNVDPWSSVNRNANGIVHVAIYIADNLIEGDIKLIHNSISALKNNRLVLKKVEEYRTTCTAEKILLG